MLLDLAPLDNLVSTPVSRNLLTVFLNTWNGETNLKVLIGNVQNISMAAGCLDCYLGRCSVDEAARLLGMTRPFCANRTSLKPYRTLS